jgi:prepilin-type N-terminal cleavage/methylation domain-containing protein
MLKSRAGFTLAEVLIALVLTAVLGAAATTTFVSQSRFFDKQDKVGAARAVSRSSLNMVLSEVRMVERSGGVEAAEADSITLNVPYAMGLYCSIDAGTMSLSMLPVDSLTLANAGYTGYAYRTSATTYEYEDRLPPPPSAGAEASCEPGVTVIPDVGSVLDVPLGTAGLTAGTPVLLYQRVSYIFRASTSVPGAIALWRRVHNPNALFLINPVTHPEVEELVAPFAPSAGFGYYVGDALVAQSSVIAGSLNQITGIELTLDGTSERPESDGSFQVTPYSTSVYFKNR